MKSYVAKAIKNTFNEFLDKSSKVCKYGIYALVPFAENIMLYNEATSEEHNIQDDDLYSLGIGSGAIKGFGYGIVLSCYIADINNLDINIGLGLRIGLGLTFGLGAINPLINCAVIKFGKNVYNAKTSELMERIEEDNESQVQSPVTTEDNLETVVLTESPKIEVKKEDTEEVSFGGTGSTRKNLMGSVLRYSVENKKRSN